MERVSSICILGVTVNDQLSAADHVNSLLASSNVEPTIRAACPTRSWHPRRVAARGFPRHSLGEDDVRLPRMA